MNNIIVRASCWNKKCFWDNCSAIKYYFVTEYDTAFFIGVCKTHIGFDKNGRFKVKKEIEPEEFDKYLEKIKLHNVRCDIISHCRNLAAILYEYDKDPAVAKKLIDTFVNELTIKDILE
jgi:hypothetical protein